MQMYGSIFNLFITWVENIKMRRKEQINVCVHFSYRELHWSQTGGDLSESPVCPLSEGLAKQNQSY